MSLFAELRRRNVIRVAMVYAVAGWVLLQVGSLLFDALGVPAWGIRLLLGLLLLGFPMAVVFAWVYELTPEGLKREHEVDRNASITHATGRKLSVLVVVLLVVAIGLLLANRFIDHGSPPAEQTAAGKSDAGVQPDVATPNAATAPGAGNAEAASIAVLPFINMSDDKANEYFSDGLTEELLNVLANVPGLRVIARTSSFSYKGQEVKIADVARELDVNHVLEGSVRKSGNRVRITTQLIRAADSSHVWSQTYDRDLKDIFAVQDEISNEVVSALKLKLLKPVASASAEAGGTQVPAAYEAFLRGLQLRREGGVGESTLRGAIAAFDEAIRLDPQYARAYAAKSGAQVLLTGFGSSEHPFEPGFKAARESAERAIKLAPDLPDALLALHLVQVNYDVNLDEAAGSIERALRLSPGSLDIQIQWSSFARCMGWPEYSVPAGRKALALDPLAPAAYEALAWSLTSAGRLDEAERVARRLLAIAPGRPIGHWSLGQVLLLQGRKDAAMAEFDQETLPYLRMTGRALAYARLGKPELARQEVAALQKVSGETSSYQYAEIYTALGDRDQALHWLGNARKVHDPGLLEGYSDPLLEPLRSDPRYQALMSEIGFTRLQRPNIAVPGY